MGNYHRETGRTPRTHDFRWAAFTRAAEEDIHPKRTAAAFDVTAETMLRYYTMTEKKKKTSDEFQKEWGFAVSGERRKKATITPCYSRLSVSWETRIRA